MVKEAPQGQRKASEGFRPAKKHSLVRVKIMSEQGLDQSLVKSKCTACRAGEPTLSVEEIAKLHPQVSNWSLVERDGIKRLERTFKFRNFLESLEFTNKVGKIAEEEGHHPAILTEWGRVTVTWWTHKIKGLHRNDFIMAAKTDSLLEKA
jgi:4a-hydroxytetrahydrobiopterin dehydratase